VPPERVLAWLTLLGLVCYGALWFVHGVFYGAFGVSLAMVGVGQTEIVTKAAVFALLFALLLVYPAVMIRVYFLAILPGSRPRWRPAALEMLAGALLLGGAWMLLLPGTPLHQALRAANGGRFGLVTLALFLVMTSVLGALLSAKGLMDFLASRPVNRWMRQADLWWLRRHRGQGANAEEVIAIYREARRKARRRATRRRERRAVWRRDLRVASRMYRLALTAMLGLGLVMAVFALAFAADDAARAQIAGRRYQTNLLYDVLTPGAVARPVRVIVQDPRLRWLEKAQLLYLGAHDGMQVLYDRTKKRAVLVPTGSVTLML